MTIEYSPTPAIPFVLAPQQQLLEGELRILQPKLADMYVSALRVLSYEDCTDRLALAAHGIRELMEKLPQHFAFPSTAPRQNMKPKVQELQKQWNSMQRKTTCLGSGDWDGPIDKHLTRFLNKIREFFRWFEQDNPTRVTEVSVLLQRSNRPSTEIAAQVERDNIRRWSDLKRDFTNMCHHRGETGVHKFVELLTQFERFLLDQLCPRTFDDFADIDQLLDGGDNAE